MSITIIGKTNFRNQETIFGIKDADRRRHLYIIGKTGTGKSTLLENMAIQDIRTGKGVAVVDPHGELAEKLLDFVPRNRINDVLYFNPADLEWPIAFNLLENVEPDKRHLVASGLIGVFRKIWADSWGPRLEYLLRNIILSLLEYPGATLLGVMRIIVDEDYRNKVVARVRDPVLRSFWVDEYSKYHQNFQVEAVSPIQNKVGQFLSSSLIRNIVGQTKSAFSLRQIMDEGKILIMNLSKGHIGEDNSALLGAMMVTKIQLAAMERVEMPEEQRRDFYLYVDEFQNFATESFANILSEARKYRLNLILAHQYIEQLPESVRDAVFGNVGTLLAFRVGARDAEVLEPEFAPEVSAGDLVNLSNYHFYIKLTIDGVTSDAFSGVTLPPLRPEGKSFRKKIIRVSRERYARRRAEIEAKIARWSGIVPEDDEIAAESKTQDRIQEEADAAKSRLMYFAQCEVCQKNIKVPFQPDPTRPVYCKQCLAEAQRLKGEGAIPSIDAYAAYKKGQLEESVKPSVIKERDEAGYQDLSSLRESLRLALQEKKRQEESSNKHPQKHSPIQELKAGEEVKL